MGDYRDCMYLYIYIHMVHVESCDNHVIGFYVRIYVYIYIYLHSWTVILPCHLSFITLICPVFVPTIDIVHSTCACKFHDCVGNDDSACIHHTCSK